MEEAASSIGETVLAKVKALARRGALLRCEAGGGALVEDMKPDRVPVRMSPPEFLALLDKGWLTASGADMFVLSKRGATALRNALSRPQGRTVAWDRASCAPAPGGARASGHEEARRPASRPQSNPDESPLAWLRRRQDKDGKALISQVEFDAGERLRADFETAQMMPRVTAAWDAAAPGARQRRGAPGAGLEMADAIVAARQRVDAALRAVGPELSGVLIDVCCFLKGLEQAERNGAWPRRSGKVVLQLALAHLARHYGLGPAGARTRPGAILHWGADGYRPAIDGEHEG